MKNPSNPPENGVINEIANKTPVEETEVQKGVDSLEEPAAAPENESAAPPDSDAQAKGASGNDQESAAPNDDEVMFAVTPQISHNRVRLRSSPGLNGEVMRHMLSGTIVAKAGDAVEGDGAMWQPVVTDFSGTKGYVRADLLSVIE